MSTLSDKALAYWILNENFDPGTSLPATAADQVGSNALTNSNPSGVGTSGGVCSGRALYFPPGTNNNLSRASTAALKTGWVEWTGWAYSVVFASGGGTPWLCKCGAFPIQPDYELFQSNDVGNTLEWRVRNSANTTTTSVNVGAVSAGWHFFDCYWDVVAGEIGLSLDGGAFVTASLATRRETNEAFALGVNPGVASFHFNNGRLSNLGCWGEILTDVERDYLRGVSNGGCPPDWPFNTPTDGIAFEGCIAKIGSGVPFANAVFGTKSYFIISSPVAGQTERRRVQVNMDGVSPLDLVAFRLQRDGDDPNDPSDSNCTVLTAQAEYSIGGS